MVALKCLAAATVLVLSAQVATACDDFDEEMAMAAAYEAAKLARSQKQEVGQQAAASQAGAASDVASIDQPIADAVQR